MPPGSASIRPTVATASGIRSVDDDFAAGVADDPGDDAERCVGRCQSWPLLDVQLDERVGQRAALDERPAAHAASLFLAEDNDRAASRALHRLDRSDDAERTVELAALGHGVEVGARPDPRRLGRSADQIPRIVDLDLEPGLFEPAARERVGLVLLRRVADPVRPGLAADRVQLLEPFERAHTPTLPSSIGTGRGCGEPNRQTQGSAMVEDNGPREHPVMQSETTRNGHLAARRRGPARSGAGRTGPAPRRPRRRRAHGRPSS